jgi:hypothetical protein
VRVLSPPCGMATSSFALYSMMKSFSSVLSPPCGIETAETPRECLQLGGCSEPTGWDGDKTIPSGTLPFSPVPSPPCGMVTHTAGLHHQKSPRSKPTAWDGDRTISRSAYMLAGGVLFLEPTGWDGDDVSTNTPSLIPVEPFQAHRVGWRPPLPVEAEKLSHVLSPLRGMVAA